MRCPRSLLAVVLAVIGLGAARGWAVPLSPQIHFNWTAQSDQSNAWFGYSVASGGDVNGDGYDDAVIGAPTYDHGQHNEGAGMAWYGRLG